MGTSSRCVQAAAGLWRVLAERTAGASAVGAPTSRGETIDSSASASTGARARGHKFTTSRSKESQKDFFFLVCFVFGSVAEVMSA